MAILKSPRLPAHHLSTIFTVAKLENDAFRETLCVGLTRFMWKWSTLLVQTISQGILKWQSSENGETLIESMGVKMFVNDW